MLLKKQRLICSPFLLSLMLAWRPSLGNSIQNDKFLKADIAICTIEKAYSLLMDTFVKKKRYELGLLIVDELHMIGEGHRGSILELLLTNIRHRDRDNKSIQIIGMSATLPNGNMLADWLDAELYLAEEKDRPIKLKEMIRMDSNLYDRELKEIKDIPPSLITDEDSKFVYNICYDRIKKSQSVLIFCSTRPACEKEACNLAKELHAEDYLDRESLETVCKELHKFSEPCSEALEKQTIPNGIGYHHAGLSFERRKIVEQAFRSGNLMVLVATTTLSMGVNLPAHLVIVRSPLDYQRREWKTSTYKQMIGRAGRIGLVNVGESILICAGYKEKGKQLLQSDPEPVHSYFCIPQRTEYGKKVCPLRKGLLDIMHKEETSMQEFHLYFSSSFYFKEKQNCEEVSEALKFLKSNGFIKRKDKSTKKISLPLCSAVQSSGLYPELALEAVNYIKSINTLLCDTDNVIYGIYLVSWVSA